MSWVSPADLDWRAVVEMTWLDKGQETGFSRHRVDHYAIGASMKVQQGRCVNLMPGPTATFSTRALDQAAAADRVVDPAGLLGVRRD